MRKLYSQFYDFWVSTLFYCGYSKDQPPNFTTVHYVTLTKAPYPYGLYIHYIYGYVFFFWSLFFIVYSIGDALLNPFSPVFFGIYFGLGILPVLFMLFGYIVNLSCYKKYKEIDK